MFSNTKKIFLGAILALSTTLGHATFYPHTFPSPSGVCDSNINLIKNGDFSEGSSYLHHHFINDWYQSGWNIDNGEASHTLDYPGAFFLKQVFNTQLYQSYTLSLDVNSIPYGDQDTHLHVYINGALVKNVKASDIEGQNTLSFDFKSYHLVSYVKIIAWTPYAHPWFDKVDDIVVDNVSVFANCPDDEPVTPPQPDPEPECEDLEATDIDNFDDGLHGWYNHGWINSNSQAGFEHDYAGLYFAKRYFKTTARQKNTLTFDLSANSSEINEAYLKVYINGKYLMDISATELTSEAGGNYSAIQKSIDFYAHSHLTKVYFKAYVPIGGGFYGTSNDFYIDNIRISEASETDHTSGGCDDTSEGVSDNPNQF